MRLHHRITVLMGVFCLGAPMGWAQDRITEADVVSTLNGKPHVAAPGRPLGVALHVTFASQTGAEAEGNRALGGGPLQADEALYKTLIPLARALEAEVFRSVRFVIRVVPNSPFPVEHANRFGQQLADRVEHFLTTYFTLPRERLSVQVALPHSMAVEPGAPPQGLQRWRLEVFRQE
jgi:hypothetical protein